MKTLQKYIFIEFFRIFIPVAIFFITIFAIVEFFWRLPDFIHHKPNIVLILKYFLLLVPLWFVQSLPMVTMLSVLLVISNFMYTKELIAIKSLGINLKTFFLTWLFLGVFISFSAFIINDKLATVSFSKAQYIFKTQIKNEKFEVDTLSNLTYSDLSRVFATIETYNKKEKKIYGVLIEELDKDFKLAKQIYSPIGEKIDNKWILFNTIERIFCNGILNEEKKYKQYFFPLNIDVDDFRYNYLNEQLDYLSVNKLRNIIRIAKYKGEPVSRYLTELGFRYALPFINFILIIIAIPLAQMPQSQHGKLFSFVFTIIALIIYWTLLTFFKNLGDLDIINPVISAWIPNIFFLFVGVLLYVQTK